MSFLWRKASAVEQWFFRGHERGRDEVGVGHDRDLDRDRHDRNDDLVVNLERVW